MSIQLTGSLDIQGSITGSLLGTASFATTASFALNAGTTVSTASLLTTASATNNVITFTKGDASTFNVTVATGSAGAAFPFTGSAQITGSLKVIGNTSITGSLTTTGSASEFLNNLRINNGSGVDLALGGLNDAGVLTVQYAGYSLAGLRTYTDTGISTTVSNQTYTISANQSVNGILRLRAGEVNSVATSNTMDGTLTVTGSSILNGLTISGSSTDGGLLSMEPWSTLPAAASFTNTFAVSGSKPYFSDGSTWNALF